MLPVSIDAKNECMDDVYWLKLCMISYGTKQRGHQKKTWWDCVKKNMKISSLSQDDAQS